MKFQYPNRRIMVRALIALFFTMAFVPANAAEPVPVTNVVDLFAGFDPRPEPLEIEIVKEWDENGVHYEQMYFTGQVFDGVKTRIYAYRGAPSKGKNLPGMLYCHGGGGSANLSWVKLWAERGYVCVSFDFSGDTNKNGLPQFRREHFTKYGAPVDKMIAERKDAKGNFWYHTTLIGRRALTLLEQHPSVDPKRMGACGVSAGGYLCWMMGGTDDRLATIVPIYGNAAGIYRDPDGRPVRKIDADYEKAKFLSNPEAPEFYAPHIVCPTLYMTASNDGFGLDKSFDTLDRLKSKVVRQLITPRYVHHMEPPEGRVLPMWMDYHLKGMKGKSWPKTPDVRISSPGAVPQICVTVDGVRRVEKVSVYYCLNNTTPGSRFWRDGVNVRKGNGQYIADLPFLNDGDRIYAFVNVAYRDGVEVSSRLIQADTEAFAMAKPSLNRELLVDEMRTKDHWYWVPAYTDPTQYNYYFVPWKSPIGDQCFTLNMDYIHPNKALGETVAFDIATQKLSDPQWQGTGRKILLMDYWGPNAPKELKIRAVEKWSRVGQTEYFMECDFSTPVAEWGTLRMDASKFKDKDQEGRTMPDWGQVQFLDLLGTAFADRSPVFKNLRWEESR